MFFGREGGKGPKRYSLDVLFGHRKARRKEASRVREKDGVPSGFEPDKDQGNSRFSGRMWPKVADFGAIWTPVSKLISSRIIDSPDTNRRPSVACS